MDLNDLHEMADSVFVMPLPAASGCIALINGILDDAPSEIPEEAVDAIDSLKAYREFLIVSCNSEFNPIHVPDRYKTIHASLVAISSPEMSNAMVLLKYFGML